MKRIVAFVLGTAMVCGMLDGISFEATAQTNVFSAPTQDITIPFTDKMEDDFKTDKIFLLFKYDYTHDEIEETIIPELLSQIGTDKIISIWDEYEANGQIITLNPDNGESETRRYQYIADLNLDEADKESAYEIAMSLYESGYFYSVEMNMIGISGDATCDNSVDVCDAVLIARFLAEDSEASMTEQGRRNADYNADGDITPDDIALILKKIARLI